MNAIRTSASVKPNGVLGLRSPELPLGATVEVIVLLDSTSGTKGPQNSIVNVAREMKLDGPVDWPEGFEEYLYGGRRCRGMRYSWMPPTLWRWLLPLINIMPKP